MLVGNGAKRRLKFLVLRLWKCKAVCVVYMVWYMVNSKNKKIKWHVCLTPPRVCFPLRIPNLILKIWPGMGIRTRTNMQTILYDARRSVNRVTKYN